MTPEEKINALYAAEINFEIRSFYDSGFNGDIGDVISGWKESVYGDTFALCIDDLWETAKKLYPEAECFK